MQKWKHDHVPEGGDGGFSEEDGEEGEKLKPDVEFSAGEAD